MEPVSFSGQSGAGLYGAPPPTHKTACPNSNNPFGHSESCPCGWARRPSQTVPYEEDVPTITPSRFTHWWPGDAA